MQVVYVWSLLGDRGILGRKHKGNQQTLQAIALHIWKTFLAIASFLSPKEQDYSLLRGLHVSAHNGKWILPLTKVTVLFVMRVMDPIKNKSYYAL